MRRGHHRGTWLGLLFGGLILLACGAGPEVAAPPGAPVTEAAPKPSGQGGSQSLATEDKSMQTATFAAGCFWGVEVTFRRIDGVVDTAVGYTGGHIANPSYREVCTGQTGHAEAVQVTYDPQRVSYEKLLEVFWANHNPTTLNRQGPDVGTQYRSAIFFHTPEQESAARQSLAALQATGAYGGRAIVTQIVPAQPFYRAEEYHQRYLEKRGLEVCH